MAAISTTAPADPTSARPTSAAPAPHSGAGLPETHPLRDGRTTGSALLAAYRGERPPTRPVWFMRQAGRSLPEYREARGGTGMLEACLTPDLAAEITLQPVRRHGVDAAILFSDIVVPLKLAGIDVEIVPGTGPVVAHPIRTAADVAGLPPLDPAALAPDHRRRSRHRRRARQHAADRVRRRTVHPGVLPGRGWPQP